MSKNRDKERKRRLYKELKKAKLFSKFCLAVASAFGSVTSYDYATPRSRLQRYMTMILRDYSDINRFVESVRTWDMSDIEIKIQA